GVPAGRDGDATPAGRSALVADSAAGVPAGRDGDVTPVGRSALVADSAAGVPAGRDGDVTPVGRSALVADSCAGVPVDPDGDSTPSRPWAVLARGTASMGGLLLLTTADLLLAGHYLAGDARGVYASGNVLTRVAFWGPQFIGTLAYPWLVRP